MYTCATVLQHIVRVFGNASYRHVHSAVPRQIKQVIYIYTCNIIC